MAQELSADATLWAAAATGTTAHILRAVRAARPSTLLALHDLILDVQRRYPKSLVDAHVRLHELLEAECSAITSDPCARCTSNDLTAARVPNLSC